MNVHKAAARPFHVTRNSVKKKARTGELALFRRFLIGAFPFAHLESTLQAMVPVKHRRTSTNLLLACVLHLRISAVINLN